MSIPCGRPWLCVSKQTADDRQAHAAGYCHASKTMTQIVDLNVQDAVDPLVRPQLARFLVLILESFNECLNPAPGPFKSNKCFASIAPGTTHPLLG